MKKDLMWKRTKYNYYVAISFHYVRESLWCENWITNIYPDIIHSRMQYGQLLVLILTPHCTANFFFPGSMLDSAVPKKPRLEFSRLEAVLSSEVTSERVSEAPALVARIKDKKLISAAMEHLKERLPLPADLGFLKRIRFRDGRRSWIPKWTIIFRLVLFFA